jgi:hypothetical protein
VIEVRPRRVGTGTGRGRFLPDRLGLFRKERLMVVTLKAAPPPTGLGDMVLKHFPPELIVSPPENPVYTPEMVADLVPSVEQFGFLVPGLVGPCPDVPPEKRLCHEGNRRLAVARILGIPFWAFDIGRVVEEAERIELLFHHHQCRRLMTMAEIAERAARYIELKQCPDAVAAQVLRVSPATLSRAFGETRIPAEYRERADRLGRSIRSALAAAPVAAMAKVLSFAETARADGKKPTRDQVVAFIQQLRKQSNGKSGGKPKNVTLRMNGRAVTLAVDEKDSATSVAEDLKALATALGKHSGVEPEGWRFLFQ